MVKPRIRAILLWTIQHGFWRNAVGELVGEGGDEECVDVKATCCNGWWLRGDEHLGEDQRIRAKCRHWEGASGLPVQGLSPSVTFNL
jgi:hypothetical protein